MRATVLAVCLAALACTLVSAQVSLYPITPENQAQLNVPRQRFYLQTAILNTTNAFGTFGVAFSKVSEYIDPAFFAPTPLLANSGTAGTLPNGQALPAFTNTTADILGARLTNPANPVFPMNNILPRDTPAYLAANPGSQPRSVAEIFSAVLGTDANGNPTGQPRERLGRLRVVASKLTGGQEYIGMSSFTPRSEFASTTYGQIIWVLGGKDASFYNLQVNIPQASRNDVHISFDSGSTWAQLENGAETDSTLATPLHWSVRNGNVAVAYKYETPMVGTLPAYRMPCPSRSYTPSRLSAQGQTSPSTGPLSFWGPIGPQNGVTLDGCTSITGQAFDNKLTNNIAVRTDAAALVTYGTPYNNNPAVVPYPSGRAQVIRANSPISTATGLSSGYVALLMTAGSAGIPSSSQPVSDAWLSLDFGATWTLQCFTPEPLNNNGPAGSSRVPADNSNANTNAQYAQNLNRTFTRIASTTTVGEAQYIGPAGYFPANVASCGFQARASHTMVTIPGVGCANGVCATNAPTALIIGGYNAAQLSLNDVYRTTDNGQTWTQLNGCDWQNEAINPATGAEIRQNCAKAGTAQTPQGYQFFRPDQVRVGSVTVPYPTGPEIWSPRNQFASAVVTVTGPGTNLGGSNAPFSFQQAAGNNGVYPFNRVIIVGGLTNNNDKSDVWASDDVFIKPGVQAAFNNFLDPACTTANGNVPPTRCGSPDPVGTKPVVDANGNRLKDANGNDLTVLQYGPYQYNQYAHWTLFAETNQWFKRRGHGVAFLACLGQLFLIGGDTTAVRIDSQDAVSLASLNDVWYSSDSGFTWQMLAANGQADLFPKRDLFGVLTTSTSLIVLGGQIQTVNGPRIANNLLANNAGINNGNPFYGDVWASAFAAYSYGPYGPCQCDASFPDSFGFQARAYACASGSPNTAGCCQGAPIIRTRCSCYTWSNPYFTTDLLNPNVQAGSQRLQYLADGSVVTAQCQANTKCDEYPQVTMLYAQSDCYDRTGYNSRNYTIQANANTPYNAAAFVAINGALTATANGNPLETVNRNAFPVVRDLAPYAGYVYLNRPNYFPGTGFNAANANTAYPLGGTPAYTATQLTFLDARDNPCDGYFSQTKATLTSTGPALPGSNNPTAPRNELTEVVFNAVAVLDVNRAQTTQPYSLVAGSTDALSNLPNYADIVSKDSYFYNNLGLARAYYVKHDELAEHRRTFLTGPQAALPAYNQFQGFYFTPVRQPQLIFPCNRPMCRRCKYTTPAYSAECTKPCDGGFKPIDTTGPNVIKCVDQFFGLPANQQPVLPARALPAIEVGPSLSTVATLKDFGNQNIASCCTENFNPRDIDFATGRSNTPFPVGQTNPYRKDASSATAFDYYFINVPYPKLTIPCNNFACPQHVLGDPEFLGFQGQKYEIHGIPDQVFNIISSPLLQFNARFVYIGHASKHACDKTRTHPWTHAGTYLGELGFKTAGGDEILMESGSCLSGIRKVTVNGKPLVPGHKVSLKHQVSQSGVHQSISMTDKFNVVLALAEFDITLTNSDHFFNQEVAMTAYGEEMLQAHGLLGQTWRDQMYTVDGVKRVIEGVPTDYLIAEEDLLGDSFAFNKFNL